MASITSWNRLEPRTRSDTLSGVEARVHDPLWMLARQWQFGEFLAEDTGSPTAVRTRGTWSVIAQYHGGATTMSVPTVTPLETMVQRENVVVSLSDRLTAGLHFLRLLGSRLAAQHRLWYARQFPISAASVTEPDEARRLAQLSSRFVPDGLALFKAFGAQESSALPPALTAEDQTAITNTLRLFSTWFEVEYQSPPSTAWEAESLRYRFDLTAPIESAPSAAGGTILTVAGNTGGHLDWYMFDASTARRRFPRSVLPKEIDIKVIPVPARFAGMPTARWWEFEDGTIDFGAIDTAPEDIGRLMLAEFALVHGNDFFVVPLELPVGALCRVTSLEVSNTFGELLEIRDVATQSWRLFRLSKDQRSAGLGEATDLFFLPPSLAATFEGTAIEEVNLLRDEMANMAWAVERVVEGPTGPINRTERENAKRVPDTPPASTSASGAPPVLEYRLSTSVPANWYPLVPEQQPAVGPSSPRAVALRLARSSAEGQLLKELGETRLHEEELPRTGTMVARKWKYARWIDGSTHVWIGRTRTLGRGEGSSGLRFDVVELKR